MVPIRCAELSRFALAEFLLALALTAVLASVADAEADPGPDTNSGASKVANASDASDASKERPPVNTASEFFWGMSTGFDFSRGRYGLDEHTNLYYVPVGLSIDYRRWRTKWVLPLLVNDGPSEIVPGTGRTRGATESSTSYGLGQLQASLSYLFDPVAEAWPYLEITGRITAPTETDGDLGTDEWAFAPQIDLFERIGRWTPFAAFGRKFYTGSRLDDRFHTSVGSTLSLVEDVSVGIAYDWFESTTGNSKDDAHELVSFATYRIHPHWSLGPYALVGLSRGAPDYGVGFTLSFRNRAR